MLIDEVHHLPEIAEKVNDKRLSINYFHKQIQQLEEPNQLFDRIQSYLPKEHEALRWLSIYQEELSALCEAQICMAEGLMSLVSGKQPNGQYPEEVMMTKRCWISCHWNLGQPLITCSFLSGDPAATVTNASDF